jgi:hypothetical protein
MSECCTNRHESPLQRHKNKTNNREHEDDRNEDVASPQRVRFPMYLSYKRMLRRRTRRTGLGTITGSSDAQGNLPYLSTWDHLLTVPTCKRRQHSILLQFFFFLISLRALSLSSSQRERAALILIPPFLQGGAEQHTCSFYISDSKNVVPYYDAVIAIWRVTSHHLLEAHLF